MGDSHQKNKLELIARSTLRAQGTNLQSDDDIKQDVQTKFDRANFLKRFLKRFPFKGMLLFGKKIDYSNTDSVNAAINKIATAGIIAKLVLRLFCGSPSKFTRTCPKIYTTPEAESVKDSSTYGKEVFAGKVDEKQSPAAKEVLPTASAQKPASNQQPAPASEPLGPGPTPS